MDFLVHHHTPAQALKDKDRLRIPRYKLEDLLAGYDDQQEQDEIAKEWRNLKPVGQEIV